METVRLEPEAADITHLANGLYPNPPSHILSRLADAAFAVTGKELNVGSFFNGHGGDYVLGYLGTSAPAADALRAGAVGTFARTLLNLAALHRTSAWRVAWYALRKAARHVPTVSSRETLFLGPVAQAVEPSPSPHPLLRPPPRIWPGKYEQVRALVFGQYALDARERGAVGPIRQPLLSQPIIELVLSFPSWLAVEGGRNRAVARDAFEGLLPTMIGARSTKGDFASISVQICARNEEKIRSLLLDGCCQSNANLSCVDGARLARALREGLVGYGLVFGLLMQGFACWP